MKQLRIGWHFHFLIGCGICAILPLSGCFQKGNDSVESIYTEKVQRNPTSLRAALELALFHLGNGEYDKAETEYKSIISHHGEVISARYHLGEVYDRKGRTPEACQNWRKVIYLSVGRKDGVATSWRKKATEQMFKCR